MNGAVLMRFRQVFFPILIGAAMHAMAQEDDWITFSPRLTKEQARPGETVTAEIAVDIAKGYHLTKSETKVAVGEAKDIRVGEIVLPQAKRETLAALGEVTEFYEAKVAFAVPLRVDESASPGEREIKVTVAYQGCSDKVCFLPTQKEITLKLAIVPGEAPTAATAQPEGPAADGEQDLKGRFSDAIGERNYLLAMVIAFIAGIGLSLTPCVYPMIPITIGVIGAGSGQKAGRGFVLSLFYVLGIAAMFSILGLAAASTGGVFGAVAGSTVFIAPLTALFVILAFGMMGAFELQLPPAIAGKFGGKRFTGVTGVFLMGFLAGVVVSPCGAPVLAMILLHVAKTGDKLFGFLMLFTMAWGLGLLFILIGTFSGIVSALPKSGGWMDTVKKTMGIIMMAAALYYAKVLLRPDALAPVVAVAMIVAGIYASDLLKEGFAAGKGPLALGAVTIFLGVSAAAWIGIPEDTEVTVDAASPIPWLHSESEWESKAILEGKPTIIDFTADWCTQCKRLSKITFHHPGVVEEAKRFIPLKLDFSKSTPETEKLKQKYDVVSLPTILFLDSSGNVLKNETVTEFIAPEQMLEKMKRIR